MRLISNYETVTINTMIDNDTTRLLNYIEKLKKNKPDDEEKKESDDVKNFISKLDISIRSTTEELELVNKIIQKIYLSIISYMENLTEVNIFMDIVMNSYMVLGEDRIKNDYVYYINSQIVNILTSLIKMIADKQDNNDIKKEYLKYIASLKSDIETKYITFTTLAEILESINVRGIKNEFNKLTQKEYNVRRFVLEPITHTYL